MTDRQKVPALQKSSDLFEDSESGSEEELKESEVSLSKQQMSHQANQGNYPISPSDTVHQESDEKMRQLETTIGEYRKKMAQLDLYLKDDEELKDNPEKKVEVEQLREQLKDNMIIHLNDLKFLQNSHVILSKKLHSGRVCEGYFSSEKTWYAALVIEVFEDSQEVEI